MVGPGGLIYVVADTFFDDGLWAIYPNGTKKWSTYFGGGFSSPAVGKDGSVYATSGNTLWAYKPDGSGTAWTFSTGGTGNFSSSSPSIGADGTIYVGSLNNFFYAVWNTNTLAPSAWPKFGRTVRNTSRAMDLRLQMAKDRILSILGEPGLNYRVEGSSNLQSWTIVGNLLSTNFSMPFRDPAASYLAARFYRVTVQ